MSAFRSVAAKLASVVEALPAIVRAYDYPLSNPQTPCAIVVPGDNLYNLGYDDGSGEQQWVIRILTGKVTESKAVDLLYASLDRSGTDSVRAALEADVTLGGLVDTLDVTGFSSPAVFGYAGAELLGVDIDVVVNK